MKNRLLTNLFLLASIISYSQIIERTRYNLDSLHFPTAKEDYKYIRIVENYNNQPNLFLFSEYTREEKLIMKAISSKQTEQKFEGPRIDYYESGNKKQESNYVDNKLEGMLIDWYENKNKKSVVNFSKGKRIGKVLEWHENGNKKLDGEYIEDAKKKTNTLKINDFWDVDGIQKINNGNGEHEEGNKEKNKIQIPYYGHGHLKDGLKDGVWQGWFGKPEVKFTEYYFNGQFISGKIVDENNIETTYDVLEKKPEHKNGIEAFYRYIGNHYRLSDCAKNNRISGKIYVSFIVDIDGKIVEPRILRDIGCETGTEALRILTGYKNFIPGEQKGQKVRCLYSLPITIQTTR